MGARFFSSLRCSSIPQGIKAFGDWAFGAYRVKGVGVLHAGSIGLKVLSFWVQNVGVEGYGLRFALHHLAV